MLCNRIPSLVAVEKVVVDGIAYLVDKQTVSITASMQQSAHNPPLMRMASHTTKMMQCDVYDFEDGLNEVRTTDTSSPFISGCWILHLQHHTLIAVPHTLGARPTTCRTLGRGK